MKSRQKLLQQLIRFRQQLNNKLSYAVLENAFGTHIADLAKRDFSQDIIDDYIDTPVLHSKLRIVTKYKHLFQIFGIEKFVAVSGSIAARTVHKEDDIDIFIVVKNNTLWIYRAILFMRLKRQHILKTFKQTEEKDLFCINFIIEERGLQHLPQNIFTIHELIHLIPILHKNYIQEMRIQIPWYNKLFNPAIKKEQPKSKSEAKYQVLLFPINLLLMFLQIGFMFMRNPRGSKLIWQRLSTYLRQGKLTTFPSNFADRIIQRISV